MHSIHVVQMHKSSRTIFLVDRNSHVVLKYNQDAHPGFQGQAFGHRRTVAALSGGEARRAVQYAYGRRHRRRRGHIRFRRLQQQSRVHKYRSTGSLILSWGEPGKSNPGDFHLPHGIGIDHEGRVVVCDRENHRVQIFDQEGEFLALIAGSLYQQQ